MLTPRNVETGMTRRLPIPAIVLCEDERCGLMIAGLTVLDRLVVALHRAGCGPIIVVSPRSLPCLKRSKALRIELQQVETAQEPNGDVLLAAGNLMVQVADVQEVLRSASRLADPAGSALPLTFIHAGQLLRFPERSEDPLMRVRGVARCVRDPVDARIAAAELWASLKSSSDGIVDKYFNRPVGRPLSRVFVHTPLTPNQISAGSILIGLAGAWFLAQGGRFDTILGAVLFQASAIVDCMDGDVARVTFQESELGKWLDIGGDQVVHAAIFVGVGAGLGRAGSSAPIAWLTASAVIGGLISFGVILRGMLAPAAKTNTRLQTLIDRATNRDFSVLVLGLAVIQSLDWFLWMAAIGSHLFWMAALILQLRRSPSGERGDVAPI